MLESSEILRFDDLGPYLLLKNGNYLYKVPFRGGWAVLKVYYGSRSGFSHVFKSLENVVFAGQTSYMPRTRLRVELECMALWRKHGFRVYDVYEGVQVQAPGCPEGGYALLEYRTGPKLIQLLPDAARPLDERMQVYRRFLAEWSRRHDLAVQLREPRLVHENGDFKHVMLFDDGFHWFDFEMVYRFRSNTPQYVSHEIIQYLWNLLRVMPDELHERVLEETVVHYPDRDRLLRAHDFFFRHPNLFHRAGRWLERHVYAKARRPDSKYGVAKRLLAQLSRA